MKKLLMTLCCLPAFSFANETGESCSKVEDSSKRLECYDSVFIKKDAGKDEATVEKSKKLIVEASFYNYGKGQFTFDTQGLEWKHF
ncbi:hypothetical protein [Mannheimia indoligenes]|uniref:hypothetical protein n=1 Tax=Mannheimia indoligenes TaxID=3103145 RepID=UPI002FE57E99